MIIRNIIGPQQPGTGLEMPLLCEDVHRVQGRPLCRIQDPIWLPPVVVLVGGVETAVHIEVDWVKEEGQEVGFLVDEFAGLE